MCAIPGDDRLGLRPGSSRSQAKMAHIPGGDCVCIWNGSVGVALFFVSAGGILYAISGRI